MANQLNLKASGPRGRNQLNLKEIQCYFTEVSLSDPTKVIAERSHEQSRSSHCPGIFSSRGMDNADPRSRAQT